MRLSLRWFLLAAVLAMPAQALAEEPRPPSPLPAPVPAKVEVPRYRVIRVMPETHEALLLDRNRGSHVLVIEGQALGDLKVTSVDEDQVVLSRGDRHFVLTLGAPAPVPAPPGTVAPPAAPAPSPAGSPTAATAPSLLDPYPAGVLDPYGTEGIREVQAPPSVRVVPAPAAPAPAPTATKPGTPVLPTVGTPLPAAPAVTVPSIVPSVTSPPTAPGKPAQPSPATPAPPPTAPVTPAQAGELVIARAELDATLSDFAKLGRDIDVTLGAKGARVNRVAKGSLAHRVGLRDGDLIVSVAGAPLRSIEDAAALYARAGRASTVPIEVVRADGKGADERVTLRVRVR